MSEPEDKPEPGDDKSEDKPGDTPGDDKPEDKSGDRPEDNPENKPGRARKVAGTLTSAFLFVAGVIGITYAEHSLHKYVDPDNNAANIPYTQFLRKIQDKEITAVELQEGPNAGFVVGKLADGKKFKSQYPEYDGIADRLIDAGTAFNVVSIDRGYSWSQIISFGLTVFLVGSLVYGRKLGEKLKEVREQQEKQGQQGQNDEPQKDTMLGKHSNNVVYVEKEKIKVTFADIQGIDEAKAELEEIIDYLKNPEKYNKVGATITGGTLLIGPPGTGKTMLAKAVAGEAGVDFLTVSGSNFDEYYLGTGLARVKSMFEQARKSAPCIVFIDEIDALGRSRDNSGNNSNNEQEKTLNQFLVELDGIGEGNEGIIIIAATNRPDVLDKALLRPGRFNRQVVVPMPDIRGRESILEVHSAKRVLADDVDLGRIARKTPGFSGADLANLVNEAGLMAARAGKDQIDKKDFDRAYDRILMGVERSMVMSEEDKRMTAYHEAGHAIIKLNKPGCDPLDKMTIMPRGQSLGVTIGLPEADRHSYKKSELLARIVELFGGRAAEELVFGAESLTTGASDDIKKATDIVFSMVADYGMSKLGALSYSDLDDGVSDEVMKELQDITRACAEEAMKILTEKRTDLDLLAAELLKRETLNADEITELLKGNGVQPGLEFQPPA